MILRRTSNLLHLCLLIILSSQLAPQALSAAVLFDFEQPYWIEAEDLQCKDHSLIKVDDLYHVFYIQSFPPEPGEYLRSEKWLGHLTSPDLRHWTQLDSILPVSETDPDGWENTFIWAPKIVRNEEDSMWFLYYTGVNENIAQRSGLAYSTDLENWSRLIWNPIYTPGAWASWDEDFWSNCRDPELFHEPGSDYYYMLNTASMADNKGAISLARSHNEVIWQDQGPFFINDSDNVLESVQLQEENGIYHLFFTEANVLGTSHMTSPSFSGGWDKNNRIIIDGGNAPEISRLDDETLFSRHDATIDPETGPRYFFRFDEISLDAPGGEAEIISLQGLNDDNWTVVFGHAFDNQPTWGNNPGQRGEGNANLQGNSYIATYEDYPSPSTGNEGNIQGEFWTGLIRSANFTVTENRIRLLVGGGDNLDRCFVALVEASSDRIRLWETGNDSHSLDQFLWNTSTLIGETVYFVIADLGQDEWQHIAADEIQEYHESGQDPITPRQPMVPGPRLDDVLANAGYGNNTAAPPVVERLGRLLAPHPNPFNPKTHLRYELENAGSVSLSIHDSSGRQVRRLFSGRLPAGPGFFTWDGTNDRGEAIASGFYLARLSLDGAPLGTQKLSLIR